MKPELSLPVMHLNMTLSEVRKFKRADAAPQKRDGEEDMEENGQDTALDAPGGPDGDPDDQGGADDYDEDDNRFEMALSSEFVVDRGYYREVLDHSPESIDLSRAASGMPLLVNHSTDDQVGVIEKLSIGSDKVLRAQVRFGRSARAQEIRQDVEDGIRRNVSVGYMVKDAVLAERGETGDTYRVTRWAPMEGSVVPIPADPSVGFNRAEGEAALLAFRSFTTPTTTAPKAEPKEVLVMSDTKAPTGGETRNATAGEIMNLCKRFDIDHERTVAFVDSGRSIDSISREILDHVAERGAKALPQPGVSLTEKEQKSYNLCRGILAMADNERSFETEVSQEIEKVWEGKRQGGLYVPFDLGMKTRAGLDSATSTKGTELKFTEPGPFIEVLRNKMVTEQLGIRSMTGLQGNLAFPRQTGAASASWVSENPGSDVSDSNLTLNQMTMSPKTLQASTSFSRQLLAQSVVDVDALVRDDLATINAIALDLAVIAGTGSGGQPTGVLSTSGVNNPTLKNDSGNGAQMAWDDFIVFEKAIEAANAKIGPWAFLTTPGVKARAKLTQRLSNTIALPIWADDDTIDGIPSFATNQVPSNYTEGTSSGVCHAVILGVWSQLILGMWGPGYQLVVDPYRLKKQGMIELTTFMLADVGVRHANAFALTKFALQ